MEANKKSTRRNFIFGTIGFLGGYTAAAFTIPSFQRLTSLWFRIIRDPSTLTNVEVNISSLSPGESMATTWKNRTIYIVRRTPEMLASLETDMSLFYDPTSSNSAQPEKANNKTRSLIPEYLIVDGTCTHLGCPINPVMPGTNSNLPLGGFICGCHNGKFDLAGRVYRGTPPPANLEVPPHYFKDENTIVIGGQRLG